MYLDAGGEPPERRNHAREQSETADMEKMRRTVKYERVKSVVREHDFQRVLGRGVDVRAPHGDQLLILLTFLFMSGLVSDEREQVEQVGELFHALVVLLFIQKKRP